ncbi:hypothetical protein NFA_43710 [Nocardia farcinica IFM 10152]|uniref:Uncharacterized protein n=1 Tax=Nocardia farcinica (strain IFM 10152) TaxID=247156 RepID=Q5YRH1_NOCFA|nr:hypothetical protein NFA_43710 [Nocardia farcinica IFM 10152]
MASFLRVGGETSCGFIAGDWYVVLDAVQIDRCATIQLVGPNRSLFVRRCASCRGAGRGNSSPPPCASSRSQVPCREGRIAGATNHVVHTGCFLDTPGR